MARIPEAEIERLKREVSLERLVETSGVVLKRTGKDLFGRCPFYADDTASLSVTPSKNLWHCLGACQAGGDVFAWVMKVKGVSFRHAYELLRADPSLAAASAGGPVKQTTVRTLPAPVARDADDQALLAQVIGYYHETLKASPEALTYLHTRGIDHPEAVERFKLGFANRTLGLRLPERNRLAGAELRARLQRLGILRDSGHEHFNGSLVIPVIDDTGAVSEIYGRKITEGLRLGTPKHLYLPRGGLGTGRGVWNGAALAASKEVIVCEALIDALTFWCAGYRNVTAAYGVEGFTEDHLAAFKRYGTERILIAYDRDDAGEKAAQRLADRLIAEGFEAWRIQFPKGMDANAYALKVMPATKSLGVVIRKSVWLGKGDRAALSVRASIFQRTDASKRAQAPQPPSRLSRAVRRREQGRGSRARPAPGCGVDASPAFTRRAPLARALPGVCGPPRARLQRMPLDTPVTARSESATVCAGGRLLHTPPGNPDVPAGGKSRSLTATRLNITKQDRWRFGVCAGVVALVMSAFSGGYVSYANAYLGKAEIVEISGRVVELRASTGYGGRAGYSIVVDTNGVGNHLELFINRDEYERYRIGSRYSKLVKRGGLGLLFE